MAEARARLLAAACEHLAVAAHYLARVAPLSPLPLGAPHPLHPLPLAGPLPHVRPLPPARLPHHHHHRHDDEDRFDDDHDDEDEDEDDDGVGGVGGGIADGGGGGGADIDDDEDDFAFTLQDAYHCIWPLLAAAPPYPLYRSLPDGAVQTPAWIWYLFGNAIVFTAAVTVFSVIVFRSSRRLLPTFLRAVLLAVTIGAEAAAAFHLPPASRLATILSYVSIILHVFVYLLAWAVYCFWSRRRLHPLP